MHVMKKKRHKPDHKMGSALSTQVAKPISNLERVTVMGWIGGFGDVFSSEWPIRRKKCDKCGHAHGKERCQTCGCGSSNK